MSGEEQLAALGYPCLQELASAAKVEPWLFMGGRGHSMHISHMHTYNI